MNKKKEIKKLQSKLNALLEHLKLEIITEEEESIIGRKKHYDSVVIKKRKW